MTVLSVFVKHYTKSQLQQMIPGLTIWRIDQARKHAAVVGAGVNEERESVVRYRLDSQKLDHFLDFISCPHCIQDVAYGTRKRQMSTGEVLQIPNVVRTVLSSRMVPLYQNYCCEIEFEPLARSTLFAVLKVSNPILSACLLFAFSCVFFFSLIVLTGIMTSICRLAFSLKHAVPFNTIFQQVCATSKNKSLSGLDSVTSEGSLAFDTLEVILSGH